MGDYKEILRLTSIDYRLRQTATSVGHAHHTVKNQQHDRTAESYENECSCE